MCAGFTHLSDSYLNLREGDFMQSFVGGNIKKQLKVASNTLNYRISQFDQLKLGYQDDSSLSFLGNDKKTPCQCSTCAFSLVVAPRNPILLYKYLP